MANEREVLVVNVQRPTWDQPLELCRCLTAESLAAVVQALFSTSIVGQPGMYVMVIKEVVE